MDTNKSQYTKEKPAPQAGAALFDPFPEPQAWPRQWDGTALEFFSRPKSGKPRNKPQA